MLHGMSVSPAAAENVRLTCLPEILAEVFSYLTVNDRIRAALVCRSWRDAIYIRGVWKTTTFQLTAGELLTPSTVSEMVERGIRRVRVRCNPDGNVGLTTAVGRLVAAMPDIELLDVASPHCWPLADRSLAAAIWPTRLSALKHLNVSLQTISGRFFGVLAECCPNVEELVMRECHYARDVPMSVWLTALRPFVRLRLFDCKSTSSINFLSEPIPQLLKSAPASLEKLVIGRCEAVTDELVEHIAVRLPRLRALVFVDATLTTEASSRRLADMKLRQLCWGCSSSNSIEWLRILQSGGVLMKHVRLLQLKCAGLAPDCSFGLLAKIATSGGCPNLVSLLISDNQVTDASLMSIASIVTLKGLALPHCDRITVVGIGHLASGQLKNLQTFDLSSCSRLKDWIAAEESNGLMSLEHVNVCGTGLDDGGIERLVRACPRLTHLGIGLGNRVTNRSLDVIADRLAELRVIVVQRQKWWWLWQQQKQTNAFDEDEWVNGGCAGLDRLMTMPCLRSVLVGVDMPQLRRFIARRWPAVELRDVPINVRFRQNVDGGLDLKRI